MTEEYKLVQPATYDRVSKLYEIVAKGSEANDQYYNNCYRFYEAAFTKLPAEVAEQLRTKVQEHHPAKTYVRDTIGALLVTGMDEKLVEGSLRLMFL